ncbi:YkvA family protein [Clostridium sp. DSM 100503]|uniref:YkvA family protein n=1 Tax=Clostridium sp. DSM 100503 TaxID=2963282 RepID=UPI002149FF93|nr:YkvA family protein [Clostridium sp. DSM 100503]MCR1951363.1 YkvA family protein [Clostridium sp. DSM 100503]
MNISGVKVSLTGEDLLSIINDFVKVDGLNLSKIEIGEEIKLFGSYVKGFKIDFIAGVKIKRVENGIIHGEVSSFKIAKIKVFSLLRKMALKYTLKSLEEKGINYEDGKIVINLKSLLKDVPYVDLDIADIHIKQNILNVDVSNINISLDGNLKKEETEAFEDEEVIEEIDENIEKVKDCYSSGRGYLENKLPQKIKTYSDYLFIIPDMAALLYRLLKDKRVPVKTKLIISGAIAYIAFPTDIIPDNIPFIGKVDEIAVAFFAIDRIIADVSTNIILENWEGKNDIVLVIKNIIEYVTNFTGARNVEKVYNFVEEVMSL